MKKGCGNLRSSQHAKCQTNSLLNKMGAANSMFDSGPQMQFDSEGRGIDLKTGRVRRMYYDHTGM